MPESRPRTAAADGMTIARRLRLLKRRTTRWFQPAVRTASAAPESAVREPQSVVARGLKPPTALH